MKTVVFTFDDGYKDTWENVRLVFEKYHIRGTFAIAAEYINGYFHEYEQATFKCISYQDVEDMRNANHEVASHSMTHAYLPKCSDEKLRDELERSRAILGAKTLVYPGGAFDRRVQKIAARFYKGARGIAAGYFEHEDQQWAIPCHCFTRHTYLNDANDIFDQMPDGNTLVEGYHLIGSDPKYPWTTDPKWLEAHVAHLARKGARIITLEEAIHAYSK